MKKLLLTVGFVFISTSVLPQSNDLKHQIWEYVRCSNVKFPEIVFAQAMLESGNMTSKVFQKCHNLFGMKYPGKRKTLATSKNRESGYAVYDQWFDSIDDYVLFQEYMLRNKTLTKEEYLHMLDKKYCKKNGYSIKLKRVISENIFITKDTVNRG